MLARALRCSLAGQLLLFFALAAWLLQATPAAGAAVALFGVLLLHALPVGLSFVLARRRRSPAPRLSFRQTLSLVSGEYLAWLLAFVFIFPCERWWMRGERLAVRAGGGSASAERPPLLLVHGYCCSRGAWWWLRARLQGAGWRVATISLEPVFAGIDDYVAPLARCIDEVLAATGAAQVVLVGHSMGGLVARAYLQRDGVAKVARLVTLGTPHQGSALARLALGENGRQMLAGSDWLSALAVPPPELDAVVICSPHDNMVVPPANLQLLGTRCVAVPGVGHLAMLFSRRVARTLLRELG